MCILPLVNTNGFNLFIIASCKVTLLIYQSRNVKAWTNSIVVTNAVGLVCTWKKEHFDLLTEIVLGQINKHERKTS